MQTLTFLFAFIAVLALIGVAAWVVRRYANNRLGANTQRGRMPRLAVIDAAAVDGRRRLVLVRRDNVEHLLMIGGPSDIVVESNIVRAMPNRDQMAPRPAVGEQPPRIAPLPDTAWSDEAAREAARSDARSTDASDHHAEPHMPEPPPRPARPSFADEVRRPAPPPMPERRGDPLTGFAPESISGRPEPAPPRLPRSEPLMPRPQRELPKPPAREAPPVREALSAREAPPIREVLPVRDAPAVRETPARAPERAAAPPPPPPPPPAPAPSSADQNLAEMAQRLEAALRRPAEPVAPPVAPETPPARTARSEPPVPAPAPQKSGFENLEDEMASLLGRPKNPS
jgi:flagellar biogenesis protein FliO